MQRLQTDAVGITALVLISLAWIIFGLTFLLRKKPPGVQEAKRAPASSLGILLQSVGFMFVWLIGRTRWWPFPHSFLGELVLAVVAVMLAFASSLFALLAARTLGKQWTYRARVIEGHELIKAGPYSVVRNPIYLGMFGMLLATGLVYSRWWNFLGAVVFFLIGNQIRIRAEEKLLRETFGAQFDDYARQVPSFLPWPF